MSIIILESDDRFHMPSLFADKILYCRAPLQDKYFEEQGGWALLGSDRRTAYRNYECYVADYDHENGLVLNEKKLNILDNSGDVFCSPHAFKREDCLIELTFIKISVLGKCRTKPINNMYKAVVDENFDIVSKPVRVIDCFVQDCYAGVENSRFRACSTPVITKPVIYIYDKHKSMQFRLKIGQVSMIQRVSTIFGSDSDLLFTVPTTKIINGKGVYEHYIYNLDEKSLKKIDSGNENPYKMSINFKKQAVWSESYGDGSSYKMRIRSGMVEFVESRISAKIDKEIRRVYLWQ